jgi:DNA-binding CsgD family transcriptional regulator
MNSEDLLYVQRRLRGCLLDTRRATMPGSSDLTAHLLLYLDDADHCWRLIMQWMRRSLDADRVDGGFASPGAIYRPSDESVRDDLPAAVDMAFEPGDAALSTVWCAPGAVVFDNVAHDKRFAPRARAQLLAIDTRTKLAIALRDGGAPVGLMCCNWGGEGRRLKFDLCQQVGELSNQILSPILAAAFSFKNADGLAITAQSHDQVPARGVGEAGHAGFLAELTPCEFEVARLVVTGMSYKEIAARLNRSFSTVDHHLRAIREKSGARSTARMIAMLSHLLAP